MAVALESNPEGTLHLIESGCYGHTGTRANGYQFDDASLSDWTNRFSTGSVSVSGGILTSERDLLLMWNKPSISPQHALPNRQIITTLRCTWNPAGFFFGDGAYFGNSVAIMSTDVLPWEPTGWAWGTGGRTFFGDKWGLWSYINGVFSGGGLSVANGKVDQWFGTRIEPDGEILACICTGGGQYIHHGAAGEVPDAPFTLCGCFTALYGSVGRPGLASWRFSEFEPSQPVIYMEWHAFYSKFVKVIGLPTGWSVKVIKVGDAARTAVTATGAPAVGGEATIAVVGLNRDMPPWDEVQVLDALNVVQHSIEVRTFQPGTYGGDVYTIEPVDNPPAQCPTIDVGIVVAAGDCDSGIPVTYPDCDAGVSVTFLAGDIGIVLCPTGASHLATVVVVGRAGSLAIAALAGIQQTLVGLVKEDDFNRADSDTVGGGWVERRGDFDIVSNFVRNSGSTGAWMYNGTIAARVEWFMQARVRWTINTVHSHIGFLEWNAGPAENGYTLEIDDQNNNIALREWTAGSSVALGGTVAESMVNNTWYDDLQMYIRAGVQEAYFKAAGAGASISATDTSHDAVNKEPIFGKLSGATNNDFDNFIACLSKNLVVTNLPTGWKAKIENSGASVVAEATESSGTATIDASLFGGAIEKVPLGGWPALVITDGSDIEQERWDSSSTGFAGVYPGDSYSN